MPPACAPGALSKGAHIEGDGIKAGQPGLRQCIGVCLRPNCWKKCKVAPSSAQESLKVALVVFSAHADIGHLIQLGQITVAKQVKYNGQAAFTSIPCAFCEDFRALV